MLRSFFNVKAAEIETAFGFCLRGRDRYTKSFCANLKLLWILVSLLGFLPQVSVAQLRMSNIVTGAPPDWVSELAPKKTLATGTFQGSDGQSVTLVDSQINVSNSQSFIHIVKEIISEAGVQSGANLRFTWDPSYQTLIIHKIIIQRGTETVDRLEPSKFKVIQQETDLNRQIYNGALTAVLFLEDVRVKDRIEFSYTVSGDHPAMHGKYSSTYSLGWSVPVSQARVRLIWPNDRQIHIKNQGSLPTPLVRSLGSAKEYVWEMKDIPGVTLEDQVPSWFPAYPTVQVSEFANWSEVATWAAGLYVRTNLDAPELQEQIRKLRRPGVPDEQIVQAALDFTENEIRYLGIEFGPNSYFPTHPLTVLKRRFGDCKDKAFLLCTLLKGLGYDATPILVSTISRQRLPEMLPAPDDFDHVIVRAVAGGITYWLDPTRSYQCGPVRERYLPKYASGLAVLDGERYLTSIPNTGRELAETTTFETFTVGGQKVHADLDVSITFRGYDAELIRYSLGSNGRESLETSYLNDYAQRFPGIAKSKPMSVQDSTNRDTVVISQSYTITNFWVLSPDKKQYTCDFYPGGIHAWITKPTIALRKMPMELTYPKHRLVHTTINLPREFKFSDYTNSITGPASKLHVSRSSRNKRVELLYDYLTLRSFVPVDMVSEHLRSLDQMESALGYQLFWQNLEASPVSKGNASVETGQFNWPIFLLSIIYGAGFLIGAIFLCIKLNKFLVLSASKQPPTLHPELNGLAGWLILVGINLFASPLVILTATVKHIGTYAGSNWHLLTTPGTASYHPLWAPLLLFEFLCHITFVIMGCIAIVLFFQKRRLFPRVFVAILLFNFVFILLDQLGLHLLKDAIPNYQSTMAVSLARVVLICSIWIPYMCVSRRVKATFIR